VIDGQRPAIAPIRACTNQPVIAMPSGSIGGSKTRSGRRRSGEVGRSEKCHDGDELPSVRSTGNHHIDPSIGALRTPNTRHRLSANLKRRATVASRGLRTSRIGLCKANCLENHWSNVRRTASHNSSEQGRQATRGSIGSGLRSRVGRSPPEPLKARSRHRQRANKMPLRFDEPVVPGS
jgi:hypothetical protein